MHIKFKDLLKEAGKESFVDADDALKALGNAEITIGDKKMTVTNYLAETSNNIKLAKDEVKKVTPNKKDYPQEVRDFLNGIANSLAISENKTIKIGENTYVLYSATNPKETVDIDDFIDRLDRSRKLSDDEKNYIKKLIKESTVLGTSTQNVKILQSPNKPTYKDVNAMPNMFENVNENTLLLMKNIIITQKELDENLDYMINFLEDLKKSQVQMAAESKMTVKSISNFLTNK